MQTWQSNVDVATGRMSVAQSALTEIQSIAADFYAQLNTVQGVNASAVDTIAASARDALGQVASRWIPRTAASTCSPARTPPTRRSDPATS